MSIRDGDRIVEDDARPYLVVDARLRRPTFSLDVAMTARAGEVVAILGPNGAGKSTVLGIIAGLIPARDSRVMLAGRTLTGDGVDIPPPQRRVGLMGQDPLLFPHLSATENIAFGPRAQGVARGAARAAAREWLERFGLVEFAQRRPSRLSGGQRQRIALARALAARPDLLLLDEPLSALDAQTAPEIRHLLRTHLRASQLTTVLVTHDVLDAVTLADRVIVVEDGAVVEAGPTARLFATPRSPFTAALAGVNLVAGIAREAASVGSVAAVVADRPDAAPGGDRLEVSGMAADALARGSRAIAVFSPSAVAVYPEPAGGSPRNSWPATVIGLEPGPSSIRVRARIEEPSLLTAARDPADAGAVAVAADLTPAAVAELGLHPGAACHLAVKATEVRIHAHLRTRAVHR